METTQHSWMQMVSRQTFLSPFLLSLCSRVHSVDPTRLRFLLFLRSFWRVILNKRVMKSVVCTMTRGSLPRKKVEEEEEKFSQKKKKGSQAAKSHKPDDDFPRLIVEFEQRGKTRATRSWPVVPSQGWRAGPLPVVMGDLGQTSSRLPVNINCRVTSLCKVS